MDRLFLLLKNSGSGCRISNFYAGAHGYADDLLFLCPSRSGLQEMLDIDSKYASDHKISFSTNTIPSKSKTKGIVFNDQRIRFSPEPLYLNGNPLPWVEKAKYLGNKVTGILDGYSQDVREKRAQYIERNCEINQEFSFAHPEVKTKINGIYNSSFPGSVLWDLSVSSPSTQMIFNTWSVSVSHRDLVEMLSGTHASTMLICRFAKFVQGIKKSPKLAVQFLYEKIKTNVITVTGRNVAFVLKATGYNQIEDINTKEVKERVKFCAGSEENTWRGDLSRK